MSIKELKEMSKETFLSINGMSEELYNSLQNSKEGWIKISRVGDGNGESGYTFAFGEGLSCRIDNTDRWYITSVIQSIDWENHTFKTLNSTYNFEFKDTETLNEERKKHSEKINQKFKEFDKNNGSEN